MSVAEYQIAEKGLEVEMDFSVGYWCQTDENAKNYGREKTKSFHSFDDGLVSIRLERNTYKHLSKIYAILCNKIVIIEFI